MLTIFQRKIFVLSSAALFTLFSACQPKSPVTEDDGQIVIRVVNKDFSFGDEMTKLYVAELEKQFYNWSGEKVKVEVVDIPEGAYAEKLNLMLLGGNIPDIIYFQGGDEAVVRQGLLIDLSPYIANSSVMQEAMLDFNRERLKNYPYLLWIAPPRVNVMLMREDWFDETGLPLPETVDEYTTLFTAIKSNHPDAYPLTATGGTERLDFTFDHAFGITGSWLKEGDTYLYSGVSKAEKEKLTFYRKLYQEALLDPEYITTKWDVMEDKLYTNQVAAVGGSAGMVTDIYENKLQIRQGVGLKLLPPAKGVGQGYSITTSKETRGVGISVTSKNPETAWRILEFLASDEGQLLERYGIPGVHHTREEGKIVVTDAIAEWWPRFSERANWEADPPLLGETASASLRQVVEFASNDRDLVIPDDLIPTWDALQNLCREYSFRFISGELPLSEFEDFVEKWFSLGGDKITEYANSLLP